MKSAMYKKILVPLDGSRLAEKALPYAMDMATRFDSEIVLIYVRLPAEDPYHPVLKSYLKKVADDIKEKTDIEINHAIVSVGEVVRHPADGIVNYASDNNIDIIIMASHGHSGIKHWALGGVSDKILRISDIPVLLVRADSEEKVSFNNILVPLDRSGVAECVFPHVSGIAAGYDSHRVTLLHIVEPHFLLASDYYDYGNQQYLIEEYQRIERMNKNAATKYLKKIMGKTGLDDSVVHIEVITGNVAESVVDYTKSDKVDLIVMASHGRSGVSRWVLGSIADRVLHYSDLPVLLVRAE